MNLNAIKWFNCDCGARHVENRTFPIQACPTCGLTVALGEAVSDPKWTIRYEQGEPRLAARFKEGKP